LNPLFALLLGGLVYTVGDILMKRWVLTGKVTTYILALTVYLSGINFLAYAFKYKDIAVASVIIIVFNVVSLSIASWLFFGETLSGLKIVAITIALIAVVILEIA